MKLPLTTMGLQKLIVLSSQKKLEPVSISELCWVIRPYIAVHRVYITKTALALPKQAPFARHLYTMDTKEEQAARPNICLDFSEVVAFEEDRGTLLILLKTGCICLLAESGPYRRFIPIYTAEEYANSCKLCRWGLFLLGNLRLFQWRLKESIQRMIL